MSDWSSVVCSSDLARLVRIVGLVRRLREQDERAHRHRRRRFRLRAIGARKAGQPREQGQDQTQVMPLLRISADRRVGKECVSKFITRWSKSHNKKTINYTKYR